MSSYSIINILSQQWGFCDLKPVNGAKKIKERRAGTILHAIMGSFNYSTLPEQSTKSLHASCPGSLRKEAIEGIISSNI